MHRSLASLALLGLSLSVSAQNPQDDPYVPSVTNCTSQVVVRAASEGLSQAEQDWRTDRLTHVVQALHSYLPRTNLTGFNVTTYLSKLNASTAPVVGLAISGGGSQSGLGGLGLWQAFDDRYPAAVEAGTGGIVQCLAYLAGLSGGGYMTVASLAANNFSSMQDVRKAVNYSTDYNVGSTGNATEYYTRLFSNTGAKAELGYPVSVVDTFGQMFSQYLPKSWVFKSYSDVAAANTSFSLGTGPMPIIALAEVVPGQSPNISEIMYPGRNATNAINLTSYEITPFEFGSWVGGRVQAFMPTKWLGTPMRKGAPQANDTCVQGFDKMSFVMGSTADAFNFWLIDAWYNIPLFAKRAIETVGLRKRQSSPDIIIPADQADSPLVQLVNQTATIFEQSFSDSLWATYPNPFQGYNKAMTGVEELLLVDGSETGETIPLRPLIIPERKLDFIIAYDSSLDGEYSWVNGTNFIDTSKSAAQAGIPFPKVPSSRTMMNLNFTTLPTFFGCNYTSGPLVLYIPNAPWSAYTNYSYTQPSFTDDQLDMVMENQFNMATYGNASGNGTVEGATNWPACLACAVIKRSLTRVGMALPEICETCFSQHCWNGQEDDAVVSQAVQDHKPLLNPGLTYEDWNQTWWGS